MAILTRLHCIWWLKTVFFLSFWSTGCFVCVIQMLQPCHFMWGWWLSRHQILPTDSQFTIKAKGNTNVWGVWAGHSILLKVWKMLKACWIKFIQQQFNISFCSPKFWIALKLFEHSVQHLSNVCPRTVQLLLVKCWNGLNRPKTFSKLNCGVSRKLCFIFPN